MCYKSFLIRTLSADTQMNGIGTSLAAMMMLCVPAGAGGIPLKVQKNKPVCIENVFIEFQSMCCF